MKNKLIFITVMFSVFIILITCILHFRGKKEDSYDRKAEQIIAVNELEQLAKSGQIDKMSQKAESLQKEIRLTQSAADYDRKLFIICGICILFIITIFVYVYYAILCPFHKMEIFAQKISLGDFGVPLDYERSNYFGAFTWAFDSMRCEITKARACEHEAVENNKTVIATLSHDIKTPVSSIRAYAEGLEANMDSSYEKREKYIRVIMKKCDEVSGLINDLFLHSLSDLDKLKISAEEIEICGFVERIMEELAAEQNDLNFEPASFSVVVSADKNRLMQVMENIINNSRKYAKSNIDVSVRQNCDSVEILVRDYGAGIPDEDMPFIFDKFYRGRNCGSEQGSGLGLYIVKYIVEKMNGKIMLYNYSDGLEVIISLPVIKGESS